MRGLSKRISHFPKGFGLGNILGLLGSGKDYFVLFCHHFPCSVLSNSKETQIYK